LNITDSRFFQIQSRALRTLFPFTNLTTVRIQNTVGFDLDDATVALLASSWPWLKQLELTTQVAGPQSRVTIGSLWYFARYCPCLEELVLTFDATVVQTPGDEASTSLFEHGLHSLEVETSAITSPIPVAEFILSIFPKLQRLTTSREDYDNEDSEALNEYAEGIALHNRWKDVESVLLGSSSPVEQEWRRSGRLP
jgi:hypothetical protein